MALANRQLDQSSLFFFKRHTLDRSLDQEKVGEFDSWAYITVDQRADKNKIQKRKSVLYGNGHTEVFC